MRHTSPSRDWVTGAVMPIRSPLPCVTGAVIPMRSRAAFAPKM